MTNSKNIKCKRCKKEFSEKPYETCSRVLRDAAALCPTCKKVWQKIHKERGLSNLFYIRSRED